MTDAAVNVSGAVGSVVTGSDVQVFAGLRDDPFVLDAQFFRIVAGTADVFRDTPTSAIGPLRGRKAGANGQSGIDSFAGFNASYIVVSVPISTVTTGLSFLVNRNPIYNIWGTVSTPYVDESYVQFERMGQPLFNTVFVPAGLKDAFNAGVPADDVARWSGFVPDALTTTDTDGKGNTISGRATLLTNLGLTALPFGAPLLLPATFNNTNKDLLRVALVPDVLRLNINSDPGDLAIGQVGLTNGRRPADDVIDIALRVLRQLARCELSGSAGSSGQQTGADQRPDVSRPPHLRGAAGRGFRGAGKQHQ